MLLIRSAVLAPVYGLIAILMTLPLLGLAWVTLNTGVWFSVSEAVQTFVDDLAELLPRGRIGRSDEVQSVNLPLVAKMSVVGWLVALFFYHSQRINLRFLDLRSVDGYKRALFPSMAWWTMPAPILLALVVCAYLMITTPIYQVYQTAWTPFQTMSLVEYYQNYFGIYQRPLIILAVPLLFVGLKMAFRASGYPDTLGLMFRGISLLVLLFLVHIVTSAVITLALYGAAQNFLPPEIFGAVNFVWVVAVSNLLIFFGTMQYVCAVLLDQEVCKQTQTSLIRQAVIA